MITIATDNTAEEKPSWNNRTFGAQNASVCQSQLLFPFGLSVQVMIMNYE